MTKHRKIRTMLLVLCLIWTLLVLLYVSSVQYRKYGNNLETIVNINHEYQTIISERTSYSESEIIKDVKTKVHKSTSYGVNKADIGKTTSYQVNKDNNSEVDKHTSHQYVHSNNVVGIKQDFDPYALRRGDFGNAISNVQSSFPSVQNKVNNKIEIVKWRGRIRNKFLQNGKNRIKQLSEKVRISERLKKLNNLDSIKGLKFRKHLKDTDEIDSKQLQDTDEIDQKQLKDPDEVGQMQLKDPDEVDPKELKDPDKVEPNYLEEDDAGDMVPQRPDSCNSCENFNFKILVNQESLCQGHENIQLLVTIATSMSSFDKRRAIRASWGRLSTKDNQVLKIVFMVGTSEDDKELTEEARVYRDIVQFDFHDSYTNLTYKTLSSLHWAWSFCPRAMYVMKTDDDMFVNTPLLLHILSQAPKSDFQGGYCWSNSEPHRERSSKWYVSRKIYEQDYFPPMCSGTGYVLSSDVVKRVFDVSRDIPYFYLEDVYVALCMNKLGLLPLNLVGFSNMEVLPFEPCRYQNYVVTSHYMSPDKLLFYWEKMEQCEAIEPRLNYSTMVLTEPDRN